MEIMGALKEIKDSRVEANNNTVINNCCCIGVTKETEDPPRQDGQETHGFTEELAKKFVDGLKKVIEFGEKNPVIKGILTRENISLQNVSGESCPAGNGDKLQIEKAEDLP